MNDEDLLRQNEELRERLRESEETLRAIREGAVDAFVVADLGSDRIYTLDGADRPYRLLVEQMQQGALTLFADGTISYANLRVAALLGVSHPRLIGASLTDFVPLEEQPAYRALLRQGAVGASQGEIQLRRDDGCLVSIHLSFNALPSESGAAVSAVIDDLTEKKHQESITEAQTQVENTLRDAARAKDELLAMLGHELRNPVGAIRNAVLVLEEIHGASGVEVQAREVIARQTAHLGKLLDDLLDFSAATVGWVKLERQIVDLVAVADNVLSALAEDDRRRIGVTREPVLVEGDAIRLEQILSNLVSNALKYTPAEGAIELAVRPEGEHATIVVKDTGIGIEPDFMPRIFEMFVQDRRVAGRSRAGFGLGLNLVRRLVELHGGTVAAQSQGAEKGSTFLVRLPRTTAAQKDAPRARGNEVRTGNPCRVLVVEDNADVRESLRQLLELAGHEVFEAGTGVSSVQTAQEQKPELVLVDIGLPDIDGYEVARRLRAFLPARVQLIALTGYGWRDGERAAADAGFDLCLLKPVDPNQLLELVAERRAAPARSRPTQRSRSA